ncbi:hypothetical protein A3H90_00610 [Candidatus Peribacteria bacterium RIFCSPLOWO2_02_FULL_55_36]|nr:MAG: hypothetical protein A3H90_00610 [Candidatus Peribacteria bacterium RIFCSPLOWO2_02_FULL_55_36]
MEGNREKWYNDWLKTHHIADVILSLLCVTAIAVLTIIQIQWAPGDFPNVKNERIAYGYHVEGTDHCAGGIADGTKISLEGCDDGNETNGDGCSSTCMVESGWTCTTASPSVCSATCGDGLKKGSEGCDDGNTTNVDGCNSSCTVESGYTCTGQGSDSCTATCGDSVKKASEGCDDGNTTNSDGCSSSCTVESGYTCTGEPSTCINKGVGGGGGGGGETLPVTPIIPPSPPKPCGNAILEPEKCEECDKGRANGTSTCTQKCIQLYCGDGTISTQIGEECDGKTEEERITDPATGKTVSRFWSITPDCGLSCTQPQWTQKLNGTWEYINGTGCKRDLNLTQCKGTVTERRVQVRPPFSCSVNGPATSLPPQSKAKRPAHCGDGILQKEEGEACDRVTYNQELMRNLGIAKFGCSQDCRLQYCGDGEITPYAPLNEECDPKHPSYLSIICAQNDQTIGCTQECRIIRPSNCIEPFTNIQEPLPDEEIILEKEEEIIIEEEEEDDEEIIIEEEDEEIILEEEETEKITPPQPTCGNAVLETGEECDAGQWNAHVPDTCRPDCRLPWCGDGIFDSALGEECDSGTEPKDECSATCTKELLHEAAPELTQSSSTAMAIVIPLLALVVATAHRSTARRGMNME